MRPRAQATLPAPAPALAPTRHRQHRRPRPERGRAAWRSGLLLGAAGAVLGATFLSAGAAFAYFLSTDSSHPAQAVAATLAAPGGGQQNGKDQAGAVAISWTAPAGYTPKGYQVSRCAGGACTPATQIGSGGCSGTLKKTSCTDSDPSLAVGQTYTYEVTALLGDNWVSPASAPFQGTTAGATTMTFTTQPSSGQQIQAAGTGSFNVTVTVQDANGSTATTDSTDNVTLAIDSQHNLGNGTLTCTGGLTTPVTKGVATFKKCAIDKAGTGYQLTASSSNPALAAPGNANPFGIIAGKPSSFTATSGGGQSASTSAAFASPLAATLQDSDGNPVPGAAVTFTAPANGASATFAGAGCTSQSSPSTCVVTTDNNGVATSSAFTATAKAGSYTISATTPGATKVTFSESDVATTGISSVTTADGSGTPGQLGAGDTITVKFSGPIDPSTVCSAWTNGSASPQTASSGSAITLDNTGLLKFATAPTACSTFRFASVGLGTQYYTAANGSKLTFSGSAITYDPANSTLAVTLGTISSTAGTVNKVTTGPAVTVNLASGILDAGDNALTGYTGATASGPQF